MPAPPDEAPRERWLRSLCRALLVLNLAYCSIALFVDELPGWKMFESVEPLDYRLTTEAGKSLDVRGVLPKNARLMDSQQLGRVVTFICQRQAERFWFEPERGGKGQWLAPGSCATHVQP